LSSVCFVQLEEDHTLADYNVQKESTLHLVLRLAGGSRLVAKSASGKNSGGGVLPAGMMQIFVKSMQGMTFAFEVKPSHKVEELKQMIFAKEGVPVHHQRLIFGGKQIQDGATLHECGVQAASTLHLVLRLLGGEQLQLKQPANKAHGAPQ
jgi:ubiquitin C